MGKYLFFDLLHHLGMFGKIGLCVFAALADPFSLIGKPGAGLIYDVDGYGQIQKIPFLGDSFTEHNIEFRLFKGRGDLILYDLYPGTVSDHLAALLQGLDPAHIQTDGGIEFQGPAAGRSFRISEHNADLFS